MDVVWEPYMVTNTKSVRERLSPKSILEKKNLFFFLMTPRHWGKTTLVASPLCASRASGDGAPMWATAQLALTGRN